MLGDRGVEKRTLAGGGRCDEVVRASCARLHGMPRGGGGVLVVAAGRALARSRVAFWGVAGGSISSRSRVTCAAASASPLTPLRAIPQFFPVFFFFFARPLPRTTTPLRYRGFSRAFRGTRAHRPGRARDPAPLQRAALRSRNGRARAGPLHAAIFRHAPRSDHARTAARPYLQRVSRRGRDGRKAPRRSLGPRAAWHRTPPPQHTPRCPPRPALVARPVPAHSPPEFSPRRAPLRARRPPPFRCNADTSTRVSHPPPPALHCYPPSRQSALPPTVVRPFLRHPPRAAPNIPPATATAPCTPIPPRVRMSPSSIPPPPPLSVSF